MDRPRNLLSHMWKTFLRALGFIGVDVTERDATLCFMWSVMAVIDNSTRTGSIKEKNCPEGFLEALCRIATLKSLPYDSEIDQVGCADAGTYMSWFRRTDFAAYTKMVKDRACEWGSARSAHASRGPRGRIMIRPSSTPMTAEVATCRFHSTRCANGSSKA